MKDLLFASTVAVLLLLCGWMYYRAHQAEELAWRSVCETVRLQMAVSARGK
jgi:hypothetical protein